VPAQHVPGIKRSLRESRRPFASAHEVIDDAAASRSRVDRIDAH
jgi:hypothetical protein